MNTEQAAVVSVVRLLVEGEYEVLAATTHGRRLSATELRTAVETYGRTLVELPRAALEELDVVQIEGLEPPTLNVLVDLWTAEEGRSDLTLELHLIARFDNAYEAEIMDLHTL